MQDKQDNEQGVSEQGFTGAPEVVHRVERPSEQVNLVLPVIAAVVVVVVIVGVMVLSREKSARWHTYTSTPAGMATHSVTLDIPPEWQIREEGMPQVWGVRIVWAAPEPKLAPGETRAILGTELQVACSKIPQAQTLDQYMEALERSSTTRFFEKTPCKVGDRPGYLVKIRQVQQQEFVYASPEGSGLMYVLKLACQPDDYEALKPTFDRVIQSYRIGG
jgi:hypothetical protein